MNLEARGAARNHARVKKQKHGKAFAQAHAPTRSKPLARSQSHKLNKAACLTFIAPKRHSTDHCHHYLQGDHDAASA
ncbi:hypothetical protein KL86DES1_21408 [uncultured Desulfovibrio sp.]|uniref:Uncharacterized protein n=1 Tax=uncultured Desulfovibrio sp. TaxID=167968 RepID=A0A212L7Q2_9BACT|nr:hypothetical protein KL86DES1_21408 [uncultured Desulfovibrio sp.]VZH34305.1 conserved protein of unknown function [Desulfovibrio sp. 86]